MDEKSFGQLVRARRKELGWTQGELAEAIHVSTDYVSRIEKGERTPRERVKIDLDDFIAARGKFSAVYPEETDSSGFPKNIRETAEYGGNGGNTLAQIREKLSPEKQIWWDEVMKMTDDEALELVLAWRKQRNQGREKR